MKIRLGLFGGSFNPVHNCHLQMAKDFVDEMKLDELLILPTGHSYHKSIRPKDDVCATHRYNMCVIAFESLKKIHVSKIDLNRAGKTYTFHTLQIVKQQYPASETWWLIGSDAFLGILNWYHIHELVNLCAFAVALRYPHEKNTIFDFLESLPFKVTFRILNQSYCELSSTAIRKGYQFNQSQIEHLPLDVDQYIKQHHLYSQ